MNEETHAKLNKLKEFAEKVDIHANLPLVEVLEDVRDILKVIASKEMPEMPKMEMPKVHKVAIEGVEVMTLKGERGEMGDVGEKGLNGKNGKDGRDGVDGKDGETPRIDYGTIISEATKKVNEVLTPLIPTKEEIENGIMKSGEKIRDSLEKLEGDERLDKKYIKGLEEVLKELRTLASISRGGGSRRVFQPYVDDFSASTDGVTKTFYLSREPLKSDTVLVWGSDFPVILRPTTDFTIAGKKLTLTAAVPSPSSGATLLVQYHS